MLTSERKEFVSVARLAEELERVKGIAADYVTFSGTGEPTLASNLGEAIDVARSILHLPVAVLTNSSLMSCEEVRDALLKADVVVAKLDAHNQGLFRRVNNPVSGLMLDDVVGGIKLFRGKFVGKLCIQIMFVGENKDFAMEIARVARSLLPDEVQLNTPLRPCAAKPLSPSQMASIRGRFSDIGKVVTVYEASRPEVEPLDLAETLRRRPKL